jgi:hypothetical protein
MTTPRCLIDMPSGSSIWLAGDGEREPLGTDLAWLPPTGRSVDVTGVVVLTTRTSQR